MITASSMERTQQVQSWMRRCPPLTVSGTPLGHEASSTPRQWLVRMLMADSPVSYAEISDQLGVPIGSIGPTWDRYLAKLRVLLAS